MRSNRGKQFALAAEERDPALEILLNWPKKVDIDQLPAVVHAFAVGAESAWRSVLEVSPRRSVLMRSNLERWPPVVACSLLLEPERDQHRRLLENLIVFCSAGATATVVIPSPGTPWSGTLVRKLRLRRVNAVELTPAPELDFERWPLRVVADVILPREASCPAGSEAWLARGGRLTTVDAESGELNVRYTAPDLQWVARRWSAWVQKGGGEDRFESVLAMRAFLRMLTEAERGLGADLRRFGLNPVVAHRDEARDLLSLRLGDRSNLEATVTPTAAVLEIDAAVGGALEAEQRERVRSWQAAAAGEVGVEDRLEIAHVLRDGELLSSSVERLPRPLSAGTLARVRTAAASCLRPLSIAFNDSDRAAIVAEARTSLLAAAEYLISLAVYRVCALDNGWDLNAGVATYEHRVTDEAISTLIKHGTLADDARDGTVTTEEGSAEALALARYLSLGSVTTSELVKAESAPLPPFVEGVLLEGLKLREANAGLRDENANLGGALTARQRTLVQARNLFSAEVGAIAIVAAVGLGLLLGGESGLVNAVLGDVAAPVVALALVLSLLGYVLARLDLCADWLVTLGRVAKGGAEGVMDAAFGAFERARRRGDGRGDGGAASGDNGQP